MRRALALVAAAAAMGCAGCGRQEAPAQEEVRPVRSVTVGASADTADATYSGEVRARYESRLGFQTSGKLVARLVELGSHVRRGQVLMRLDPAQEALHVTAATADVEAARSRVDEARVELRRTEQLLARQFASQAEVDKQRLALQEAESRLKSALAQEQIRRNQRGYTEIVADRDGVVSALGAEVGQVVSAGQPVVTLAADGEREVVVSIAESRVDELRRAKQLQVTLWAHPGKVYPGALRELAPQTDSVTRTYAARITVKNADDALMLGMTASVLAADPEGPATIRLPLAAVDDRDGHPRVWVIDPKTGRANPRPVTLGSVQNGSVQVSSGLSGGETVVTAGSHMLHAGQKVKPAQATLAAREIRP